MTSLESKKEFDRQVSVLIQKGYPEAAHMSEDGFTDLILPLQNSLENFALPDINIQEGQISFVIVVTSTLISTKKAMSLVEKDGKKGIIKLFPHEPTDFSVLESVIIPDTKVYLLVDIDRGKETLNVRPQDAFIDIQKQNRSPLTIDEGVALVTQFPEFLIKNNCFSLLASRHTGDKRVPAIWINGEKHPNLGWCWDGNPHTWLGSASCSGRLS